MMENETLEKLLALAEKMTGGSAGVFFMNPAAAGLFPHLKTAHLSGACGAVKRLHGTKICMLFEHRETAEYVQRHPGIFWKTCPFGVCEAAAAFRGRSGVCGYLHLGGFRPPEGAADFRPYPPKPSPANAPELASERLNEAGILLEAAAELMSVRIREALPERTAPAGIREAVEYFINGRILDEIGLSDLAEFMHWSREHTSRRVRRIFGRGFCELLTNARIENACRLLESGELTVQQTGLYSGFSDAGYYSRVFHREKGCTPGEYKKRHGKHPAPIPGK